MTSPQATGADEGGPAVQDAAGPFHPLPYDPELVIAQHPLGEDLEIELHGSSEASLQFDTHEDGGIVRNVTVFTGRNHGVDSVSYLLTVLDIHDAIRGDIDSMELTDGGLANLALRTMRVAYPRLNLSPARQATLDERQRTYQARRTEQLRVRQLRQEAARRAESQSREQWEAANKLAQETLGKFLNEEQLRTRAKANYFDLTGSHGTRYRIMTNGYSGNVQWVNSKGHGQGEWCGHCGNMGFHLPIADHNLTQFLELVTNEINWLDTAIRQSGEYPPAWFRAKTREKAETYAYAEKWRRDHRAEMKPTCPCGCED